MGDIIAETSKHMGLSEHTLRYHEKEGLLPSIGRDSPGCRPFQENDYEWIEAISCLKNTGMTTKGVRQFMNWCEEGGPTLQKRLELFLERRCRAEQQTRELGQYVEKVEKKIRFHETAVKAGTAVVHNGESYGDYDQAILFNGPPRMIICYVFAQPICGVNFIQPIWRETSDFWKRLALSGDITAPVAIIGGGLAGISTAYLLRQKGIESAVLGTNRIGSGQTQNTAAKIIPQHSLTYTKLFQNFSREETKQYVSVSRQAIRHYRQMITREQIDCQLEERPAYLYSVDREDIPALEVKVEYTCRVGIHAELMRKTTLPFEITAAAQFGGRAQFHPLEFLQATSEPLMVYERTKALLVGRKNIMVDYDTVTAEHIAFASHLSFADALGCYFMRIYQEHSYTLALQNAAKFNGMYLGIGEKSLPTYNHGDTLLLGRGNHRVGENKADGKYDMLREVTALFYPQSKELAHWSAQDCVTLDSVPYIGQFSSFTPSWYVTTGFDKWGMTSSMVSAIPLSDQIAGDEGPFASVSSPL